VNDATGRGELRGFAGTPTVTTARDGAHEVHEAWASSGQADLVEGCGSPAHRVAAEAVSDACPELAAEAVDAGRGAGLAAGTPPHGRGNLR